jgi:hypothetical protein
MREHRTAEYLIRHNVQDFACEGLALSNTEMDRLRVSADRQQAHVRDHGECSHGCCEAERITHHRNGDRMCRWARRSCPKVELAGLLEQFATLSMGDDNGGDTNQGERAR